MPELHDLELERPVRSALLDAREELLPESIREDELARWILDQDELASGGIDFEPNRYASLLLPSVRERLTFYFAALFRIGRQWRVAESALAAIAELLARPDLDSAVVAGRERLQVMGKDPAGNLDAPLRIVLERSAGVQRESLETARDWWGSWQSEVGAYRDSLDVLHLQAAASPDRSRFGKLLALAQPPAGASELYHKLLEAGIEYLSGPDAALAMAGMLPRWSSVLSAEVEALGLGVRPKCDVKVGSLFGPGYDTVTWGEAKGGLIGGFGERLLARAASPSVPELSGDRSLHLRLEGSAANLGDFVESFSWGLTLAEPPVRSVLATVRTEHSDLSVVLKAGAFAISLQKACQAGESFSAAVLTAWLSDRESLRIELSGVQISSFQLAAGSGASPTVSVSLRYAAAKLSPARRDYIEPTVTHGTPGTAREQIRPEGLELA
jgi:hypothetical protein